MSRPWTDEHGKLLPLDTIMEGVKELVLIPYQEELAEKFTNMIYCPECDYINTTDAIEIVYTHHVHENKSWGQHMQMACIHCRKISGLGTTLRYQEKR